MDRVDSYIMDRFIDMSIRKALNFKSLSKPFQMRSHIGEIIRHIKSISLEK